MKIREMTISGIKAVLPLCVSYYNEQENSCWIEELAGKRIHQVLGMEDSFSLIVEEDDAVFGFAMGYFKQYDDIIGYTLEEIVIAYEYQNQGIGSFFLCELERIVKKRGLPVSGTIKNSRENMKHHPLNSDRVFGWCFDYSYSSAASSAYKPLMYSFRAVKSTSVWVGVSVFLSCLWKYP